MSQEAKFIINSVAFARFVFGAYSDSLNAHDDGYVKADLMGGEFIICGQDIPVSDPTSDWHGELSVNTLRRLCNVLQFLEEQPLVVALSEYKITLTHIVF